MALSVAKWYDYRPDNQDVMGSNVASSWSIFLPLSFILMYYSVLNQGPQGGIELLIFLRMLNCAAWGRTRMMCTDLAKSTYSCLSSYGLFCKQGVALKLLHPM